MSRAALKVGSESTGQHGRATHGVGTDVGAAANLVPLPSPLPLHERLIQTASRVVGVGALAAGYALTLYLLVQ